MLAQLAARRHLQEQQEKGKKVQQHLQAMTVAQAAKGDEEAAAVMSSINSRILAVEQGPEQQQLVEEQAAMHGQLLVRYHVSLTGLLGYTRLTIYK